MRAIRTLQKFGHLPSDASIFRSYAHHGIFQDVRVVAIEALVDFIKSKNQILSLKLTLSGVMYMACLISNAHTSLIFKMNSDIVYKEDKLFSREISLK